ncbi:MAG: WecB/TagA/CpsF family glycosyltransferase [Bacteroidales bacterium]|nr:WecB/TagA/CpsF family glycosyltransferase [Bacteroidales bacterium]
MSFNTTRVFSFDVFADDLQAIRPGKTRQIVNTINAYSYIVTKKDKLFKTALEQSDILLPDGFPVVTAAKWLNGIKIRKIAGADIFFHLCRILNTEKGSCFFLGSSEKTLGMIESRLKSDFPGIKAGFYSPPYKPVFSDEDNQQMLEAIAAFNPDVIFVGMTAPKQEKWVHDNAPEIGHGIICSIGAVFDFYAGSVKRPSQFWIKLKLEWFIRLLKEPKRLWKRYLVYSPLFFVDLILFKIKLKKA